MAMSTAGHSWAFLARPASAAGVSGGVMAGMAQQARAAGTSLSFEGWGGVVSEALRKNAFDPYEAASGNKVIDSTFGGENEVLTKIKAAGNADGHNILHSSGVSWYKRWVDAGYGSELNEANIPNLANVMEAIIAPFRVITPNSLSAVPYDYGTTGIAYNTKYITKEEAEELGANLLLKKELKGKIGGWAMRPTGPGMVHCSRIRIRTISRTGMQCGTKPAKIAIWC